jgi:hypothetical protein
MSLLIGIVLGLSLLLALAAGVGAAVWALSRASKTRNASISLAQQLGWQPITPGRAPADTWYGGVAHDRRVAIKVVALRNVLASDGARRSPYLRIAMEVLVAEPLGVMAFRRVGDPSSLHRFEEAFSTENASRIGPQARKAMIDFVARGYPTGLQGTSYRSSPGTRNLWLKDRARIEAGPLDPAVLPDARTVLVHDHPDPALHPDAFGKLLHEMAVVAWTLESRK